jgi:hypothetical protein
MRPGTTVQTPDPSVQFQVAVATLERKDEDRKVNRRDHIRANTCGNQISNIHVVIKQSNIHVVIKQSNIHVVMKVTHMW